MNEYDPQISFTGKEKVSQVLSLLTYRYRRRAFHVKQKGNGTMNGVVTSKAKAPMKLGRAERVMNDVLI